MGWQSGYQGVTGYQVRKAKIGGAIMSDTMLACLISSGVTLLVCIVTFVTNTYIERFKSRFEWQQKEFQSKREYLSEVYKELISIINLYPASSPNDILKNVEYAPNYFMENFDAILKSLDYQIEHHKKQLNIGNIDYKQRNDVDEQISNREYAKKKICEVRDEYYAAKDKYKSFCESDKATFDLHAGQDVRNSLVEFEVIIHNVFISGRKVGNQDDPINNSIQVSRRNLVNSMRNDIGIN